MAAALSEAAAKALAAHGIGAGAPPKNAELWEQFKACGGGVARAQQLLVQNRFYPGCDHNDVDWSRPVHAIFVDFKGDSMQVGMILDQLAACRQQYVFVAGGLPAFNGGWHFTAVNDFEQPSEQSALDPKWRDVRIWTRANYVCSLGEGGAPAVTPRAAFDPAATSSGAIPVGAGVKFETLIFTGGLMPHTMNATAVADNGPMNQVIAKHVSLGATIAAIGHGLDVLIACGTPERSLASGFMAAAFPRQERLMEISGMRNATSNFCVSSGENGATLISASCWSASTAQHFFEALKLNAGAPADGKCDQAGPVVQTSEEPVIVLDLGDLPGMRGSECLFDGPRSAVFVDEVADPIEIFTIVARLVEERMSFQLISHSSEDAAASLRRVTSETVFGNPMYGLRECTVVAPTTPANLVGDGVSFDSFFVAGGQCPYHLLGDAAVLATMDKAEIAAAVCHGPEALLGSKWMRPEAGRFTSYYGCWVSFRDMLERYERKKPGETSADNLLFTGNAPNATRSMVDQACAAIRELRGKKP